MGGVADAQEPGPPPAGETVDPHRQQGDVVPRGQLGHAVGQERNDGGDVGPEGFQAPVPQRLRPVLGHHVADLPVLAPVDEDDDPADVEAAHGRLGIVRLA
jgi:hypothetical protein